MRQLLRAKCGHEIRGSPSLELDIRLANAETRSRSSGEHLGADGQDLL
ncbi:MAG: hypothetical protein ACRDL5_10815 [Solirubrobacteraceae bacterium]